MGSWDTSYADFDHALKDEFILILCSQSNKELQ